MSTFVMSDIHGCYNEFISMLAKISFSSSDLLVMAGDYIDRGKQSREMLEWIEHAHNNVILLRGNHEEEFISYVDLMCYLNKTQDLKMDFTSNDEAIVLYETVNYLIRSKGIKTPCFDVYNTVRKLLSSSNKSTLDDLCRWKDSLCQMPYYKELVIGSKNFIIVHAGYTENLSKLSFKFSTLQEFYLYAREESIQFGGKQNSIIVAGHTPTIVKGTFAYNEGNVFKYYNQKRNCTFYDIDCGCVFRNKEPRAKLACLRLEDEKIFYV